MSSVLILNESQVRGLLEPAELFDALRSAMRELSAGRTSVPPRVAAFTPNGLLAAMPGHVPGAGLVGQARLGLSREFDTGPAVTSGGHRPVRLRGRSLAGADGRHLDHGRPHCDRRRGRRQGARPRRTRRSSPYSAPESRAQPIWTRSRTCSTSARSAFARETGGTRRPSLRAIGEESPCDAFEEAVRGADVICCCTDAHEPVIRREWISNGAHVGSVGSGPELDDATLADGKLFVEWRGAVTNAPPAGAVELQGRDPASVTEIGEVLSGDRPGRTSAEQLTVYKSTGHAAEDAAAAGLVYAGPRNRAWDRS